MRQRGHVDRPDALAGPGRRDHADMLVARGADVVDAPVLVGAARKVGAGLAAGLLGLLGRQDPNARSSSTVRRNFAEPWTSVSEPVEDEERNRAAASQVLRNKRYDRRPDAMSGASGVSSSRSMQRSQPAVGSS